MSHIFIYSVALVSSIIICDKAASMLKEPNHQSLLRISFMGNLNKPVWVECIYHTLHFSWIYWQACACVYLWVYLLSSENVCASQRKHTQAEVLVRRFTCLSPSLRSRLVASFPGSSHLPTLLLFVAFQSWEKQRQLVGSTANPQGQAVFLRKKVEQKYSAGKQTRGSSSLGHSTRSPSGGAGGTGARQARLTDFDLSHPGALFLPSLKSGACTHLYTHTNPFVSFIPKWKLPNAACIRRASSPFTNCVSWNQCGLCRSLSKSGLFTMSSKPIDCQGIFFFFWQSVRIGGSCFSQALKYNATLA